MFRSIATTLSLLALPCLAATAETWNFAIDTSARTAIVYAPAGLPANPPLFISMHGLSGDAAMQQYMAKVEPVADTAKFVVVYPAGLNKQWDLSGTLDLNFLLKIIDSTAARYGIDRNRVYSSGFSMGGMMSYYFACKYPEKVAAIGPGSGYPLGGQYGCLKTRPVPIIHVHGALDTFVAYKNLHTFLNTKINEYGCPTRADTAAPYPANKPSSTVTKESWGPCTKNGKESDIVLLTVGDMTHNYTLGPSINSTVEIWNFVKRYSLGGGGSSVLDRGAGSLSASIRASRTGIHVASSRPILGVRIVGSNGRVLSTWNPGPESTSEAVMPVPHGTSGILLAEVASAGSRIVRAIAIP